MNQQMWAHPAVNLNVQTLRDMNYQIIQPASGEQACGDVGAGRLPEPEQLLGEVLLFIAMNTTPQLLAGKRVVITATTVAMIMLFRMGMVMRMTMRVIMRMVVLIFKDQLKLAMRAIYTLLRRYQHIFSRQHIDPCDIKRRGQCHFTTSD